MAALGSFFRFSFDFIHGRELWTASSPQKISSASCRRSGFTHHNGIAFTFVREKVRPAVASQRGKSVLGLKAFGKEAIAPSVGASAEKVRDVIAARLNGSTIVGPEVGVTQVRRVSNDACTRVNYVDELSVARVEDEISPSRVLKCRMCWI
jgi:hypothetical protein